MLFGVLALKEGVKLVRLFFRILKSDTRQLGRYSDIVRSVSVKHYLSAMEFCAGC